MQHNIKTKQTQWGIILTIGLLILMGTVGNLETGGELLPNVFKGVLGIILSIWGLIKTYQWSEV